MSETFARCNNVSSLGHPFTSYNRQTRQVMLTSWRHSRSGESDMTSIVFHSKSGPDSKLHLDIPVGTPNAEYDVEVMVRPTPLQGQGWPPGYFALFGAID